MKSLRSPVFTFILIAILVSACSVGIKENPTAASEGTPTTPPLVSATLEPVAAPSPTAEHSSTPAPSPVPTQLPTTVQQPQAINPSVNYRFNVSLDYDQHTAEVEQAVTYTNRTGEPLNELAMVVQPAEYPGAFHLTSAAGKDGSLETVLTGSRLTIKLDSPLDPESAIEFTLVYTLALPVLEKALEKGPIPFGYTENQTNLVDWYPFIPVYQSGQGWLIHPGHEYGEHIVYESAAYTVDLRVAGNWAKLFVAASTSAEMQAGVYHYEMPEARSFAITVSHLYEEISETVGSVNVTSFAFPIHKKSSQAALKTTVEALKLYEELFGPYPHPQLTVVEADFLDGMEYDGLYFLSRGFYNLYAGTPGEYLVAIAAHETAHQWWYALVGNDQALEPWLDEALCTYSEKLYYERYSPEGLKWWWEYRVAYYNPEGWVDTQIYPPQGKTQAYRQYRNAVYLRGAMFLEELRKLAGDEAFFAFLKDYTAEFSGKAATRQDFFETLARHSQVDFSELIASFFQNP